MKKNAKFYKPEVGTDGVEKFEPEDFEKWGPRPSNGDEREDSPNKKSVNHDKWDKKKKEVFTALPKPPKEKDMKLSMSEGRGLKENETFIWELKEISGRWIPHGPYSIESVKEHLKYFQDDNPDTVFKISKVKPRYETEFTKRFKPSKSVKESYLVKKFIRELFR